jgi:glycosyltransferase involved in cell wall biosynthesis
MQNKNLDVDLVTVVTVTFNAENLLEETILSIINQSYKNIEYIIIDGGSTDGTVDIIKKYEDKIDYWVSEPDDGLYFAMNKAIKKATGKWINFMNAGDTFFDMKTVQYVMEHKSDNAEMIYGNYRKKFEKIERRAIEQSKWLTTMPFCHQTLFAKTSIMKINPFDTTYKIVADLNFIQKMIIADKNFNYIDRQIAIFSEGGFADSNIIEMCIESLRSLLQNDIDIKFLYESSWYRYLYALPEYKDKLQFSDIFLKQLQIQQIQLKEMEGRYMKIMYQFSKISTIQTWRHPIQKIKAYKKLLSVYAQLQEIKI